ncbi:MAG: YfcE family phosphodiesterase [Candidatus Nanohaloarchaea archaeon]
MLAVLSDSHVPNRSPGIAEEFIEKLREADVAVHCGDFATEEVYEDLEEQAEELHAVKGNCDFFDLPNSETFEREGVKFGVYHGTGITPRGDHETLVDIAQNKLEVDVLLTGHTHQQEAYSQGEVILLNPGTCTGVGGGSYHGGQPKMMTLEVEEDELLVKKHTLDEDMKLETGTERLELV